MVSHDEGSECPVCAARVDERLGALEGRALRRCRQCHHAFLDPPTDASAALQYNDHYVGFREDTTFTRSAETMLREQIAPFAPPPARLLDVGCGNGAFLASARAAGYAVTGIDASPAARELCLQRGIEIRVGDLREAHGFGDSDRFDLITFWDVIEHLAEPRSFLERAAALLQPGGHVLIKTPRTSRTSVSVAARLPRVAGAVLHAPSHIQYFQRADLSRMLHAAGFVTQRWLEVHRPMRSTPSGGTLRRRLARTAIRALHRVAGDGTLLVLATMQ